MNFKNNISPLVSVIIPTYNRGQFIKKAIDSVLNQTYTNYEIIIIDDASIDKTEEIIKNIKSSKIRYFKLPNNYGVSYARNKGIKESKGYFVIFLDSDDEFLPKKLEKHINYFNKSSQKTGVVYSGCWLIKGNKKYYSPNKNMKPREGNIWHSLFKWNCLLTIQSMVKKSVFDEIGFFNEKIPRLEDWEFWIRVSKKYEFKFIEEPLHIVNYSQDCRSSNYEKIAKSAQIIMDEFYNDIKDDKEILSSHYFFIGYYYILAKKNSKARKNFLIALKNKPFKIKNIIFFILSLLGHKVFYRIRYIKNFSQ